MRLSNKVSSSLPLKENAFHLLGNKQDPVSENKDRHSPPQHSQISRKFLVWLHHGLSQRQKCRQHGYNFIHREPFLLDNKNPAQMAVWAGLVFLLKA